MTTVTITSQFDALKAKSSNNNYMFVNKSVMFDNFILKIILKNPALHKRTTENISRVVFWDVFRTLWENTDPEIKPGQHHAGQSLTLTRHDLPI